MLEKMSEFFENRLDSYDNHMLTEIEKADEFYPFTASLLPKDENAKILDLGCGTGLELEFYFPLNPAAKITGIDLSKGMLNAMREKFPYKNISLICGSYFDVPFGENAFDAAVSVESLHHFTAEEKRPLYEKLYRALKKGGYFILTDYLCKTEEEEKLYREAYLGLKKEQGITDNEFYHYDTPLTLEHEIEVLKKAGFSSVKILGNWENTYTIKAVKYI